MKKLAGSSIANAIIITAIVCVPLLYSGLLTWAYQDPMNRLDRMDAAIVNLDKPIDVTSTAGRKHFDVGKRLSDALVNPKEGHDVGFDWHETDQQTAQEGLANGTYRAVLSIPSDFSQNLSLLAGNHPETASPSTLTLTTDDGVNYLAGTMAQTVSRELETIASSKGASEYIDTVLVSLSSIHNSIDYAAQGANELSEGTEKLKDGSQQLTNATAQLEDGTQQLAQGSKILATGNQQLADGTTTLVTGLRTLASGSVHLSNGSAQVASGADRLASGIGRLYSGAKDTHIGATQLQNGLGSYTNGVEQVSLGAAQLKAGMETAPAPNTPSYVQASQMLAQALTKSNIPEPPTLKDGASSLREALTQFGDGLEQAGQATHQLEDGSKKIKDGSASIAAQFHSTTNTVPTLFDASQQLKNGAANVNNGAQQLSTALDGGVEGNASPGSPTILEGAQGHQQLVTTLKQLCTALPNDPVCVKLDKGLKAQGVEGISGLETQAKMFVDGVNQAAAGAHSLAQATDSLADGNAQLFSSVEAAAPQVDALSQGSQQLKDGVSALQAAISGKAVPGTSHATPSLQQGYDLIHAGAVALDNGIERAGAAAIGMNEALNSQIMPGITQLVDGSSTLVSSSEKLNSGARQLNDGTQRLADGSSQLNSKTPALTAGAHKVAAGAKDLKDGSNKAANGAGDVERGAKSAANGAKKLADGAAKAHDGSTQINSGSQELSDGIAKADNGAFTLASGLSDGAEKIPYYSDSAAQAVADTAGHPIEVDAVRAHPASHNGTGFAPFFMALSLWVGAIAMFFVFPSLDVRRATWEKWWICALRPFGVTVGLGVLQAVAVVTGLELLLDLSSAEKWSLFGVVTLASLCFVSINQACVATLGYRGRFVSVLLLILQIASMGATFPIETAPRLLQILSPLFPMTYLAEAIRTHIVGGGISLTHGIVVIILWMLVAWVLTLIAAKRRTGLQPMPFDPALAFPGTPAANATSKISIASL
ncbi:MAG: YhgE/Pip domain-containing protein [Actinomycetaceae bacterium]|nr:YhgE/Pip domain-containing protein [Actinomycetaceae bacterium]